MPETVAYTAVMGWLPPPSDDDPAVILRWVRRVYLVLVPLGLLLSLLLGLWLLRRWGQES